MTSNINIGDHSRAPRLQAEFLPGHLGGLLGKVLVTLGLLPHVVILHALADRARADLKRRKATAAAKVAGLKRRRGSSRAPESHLVGLNEVEAFAVNSIAVLKAPALFLTPRAQI